MKLIVGLGNYPIEYHETRHNAGFMVIDEFCLNHRLTLNQNKFNGWFIKTKIYNQDVIVAKPYTYMNLSGQFVRDIMHFYQIDISDLIVISDDVDLLPGMMRIKPNGSSAGQKGIQNIIDLLGTNQFKRIRIGIGKPINKSQMVGHVTGEFTFEERQLIDPIIKKASCAIDAFLKSDNINQLMNQFNK
ncbi:peptidyl-tRNA hydrolase [Candidatus Malacoplasma girerdii]|uniref:Peptidyl-tRNA hydrolase n=1 Tax=Candidatus Malacoplasma girerdii TaxID=1318617 RepID=A0A097SSE6_9BACT|nr:peptidyl-tRNA hydrolase [Candidatus Malacoplasma girerdii]ASJ89134.1 MAG: peptidyl-tRNA hydrolase [Candidatus Malacoplasma girerdii]